MPLDNQDPQPREDAEARLARELAAQRSRLLRRHRHRLAVDDLDDCLSQAALELVSRARRVGPEPGWHPGLALEQRFLARVSDRRRALGGRSPRERLVRRALIADDALIGDAVAPAEVGASVEEQIVHRDELRRLLEVVGDLSEDQRLVATFRLFGDGDANAWRVRHGWSVAKYEKTASRARAALTALRAEYDAGERCRRLAPDLHAAVFGGATPEQRARAGRHVRNCRRCAASTVAARRRRRRRSAAAPGPATRTGANATAVPSAGGAVPTASGGPVAPRVRSGGERSVLGDVMPAPRPQPRPC